LIIAMNVVMCTCFSFNTVNYNIRWLVWITRKKVHHFLRIPLSAKMPSTRFTVVYISKPGWPRKMGSPMTGREGIAYISSLPNTIKLNIADYQRRGTWLFQIMLTRSMHISWGMKNTYNLRGLIGMIMFSGKSEVVKTDKLSLKTDGLRKIHYSTYNQRLSNNI
jgi:hypothetical protein